MAQSGTVDLYWIPLGAGNRTVRMTGVIFESLAAMVERRARCELYHSALVVAVPEGRFTIEQAPVPDRCGWRRGVVAEGPVGTAALGRLRLFRYEVRSWRDGLIPDIETAVASPLRVSEDLVVARRVISCLASLPTPTWGRDQLRAGEMWNSNSIVAWALTQCGVVVGHDELPPRGRAPGWDAGVAVASRAAPTSPHAAQTSVGGDVVL